MKEILKCMDKIPQGVFLVGTKKGEGYNLMTAAFVTQVSFNPASIAVSVAVPPVSTVDRIVEMAPDIMDKVEKYFDRKESKETL